MHPLSDRATLVAAQDRRDGDQITGVQVHGPLAGSVQHGTRSEPGYVGDSEGIAVAPGWRVLYLLRRCSSRCLLPAPATKARVLPRPKAFDTLDRNGSFEGLAIDDLGRLYTLTEKSRTAQGDIPVYRWDGQAGLPRLSCRNGAGSCP